MSFPTRKKGHTRRPRGHKTQQCETGPAADKGIAYQDQYSLYKLIWTRFWQARWPPALFDSMQVNISNGDYGLRANGSKLLFDGYQKIYSSNMEEDRDKILPDLSEGEALKSKRHKERSEIYRAACKDLPRPASLKKIWKKKYRKTQHICALS